MSATPGRAGAVAAEPSRSNAREPANAASSRVKAQGPGALQALQQTLGNRAIATMLNARPPAAVAAQTPDRLAAEGLRRSTPRPLDPVTRTDLEQRFGEGLGSVRVHTSPAACDAVNATAYTVGEHIAFNAGTYAPQRPEGRALLAHEVAHVLQQRRGPGFGSAARAEGEAGRLGRAVARGAPAVSVREGARVGLARQEKPGAVKQPVISTDPDLPGGRTAITVDDVTILRFSQPEHPADLQVNVAWRSEEPNTIYFHMHRLSTQDGEIEWAGLRELERRGFKIVKDFKVNPAPVGERVIDLGHDLPAPPPPPRPPAPRPRPPPKPVVAAKPPVKADPKPDAKQDIPKVDAAPPPDKPPAAPVTPPVRQPAASAGTTATPSAQGEAPGPTANPDLDARAKTVRANLKSFTFNFFWRESITDAFKGLGAADFQGLQDRVGDADMGQVFDQLEPFEASLIGSFGAITKGRDALNAKRTQFLIDISDWGSRREAFYDWMFDTMSLEDIRDVLHRLAAEKRLGTTVLSVPDFDMKLIARGVDPADLREEETTVLEGIGRGLGHVWTGAWSGTVFASGPGMEFSHLPKPYQEQYHAGGAKDFAKATEPANVAQGAASYVTFGLSDIPIGVYQAVDATADAAVDLWNGKTGSAAEKFTPVLVTIMAVLITHKVGKLAAASEESALARTPKVTPPPGGVRWSVRAVGKTAEGLDRLIVHDLALDEYAELVVDPEKRSVRAVHLGTREVITFEDGKYSRPGPGLPPASNVIDVEGVPVADGQPPAGAAPPKPAALGAPQTRPLLPPAPQRPVPPPASQPLALPPGTPLAVVPPPEPIGLPPSSLPAKPPPANPLLPPLAAATALKSAAPVHSPTATLATPPVAAPVPAPVAAPPAAAPPVTALTLRADDRAAQTAKVLTSATDQANAARAVLADAETKLQAAKNELAVAKQLAAEAPGSAEGVALVAKEQTIVDARQTAVDAAQAALKPLAKNQALAAAEHAGVAHAQTNILKAEATIAAKQAERTKLLNPSPGGWTKEQLRAGRRSNMTPMPNTPEGKELYRLDDEIAAAKATRADYERALTISLKDVVDKATPGPEARPVALANAAAQSDPVLHPIGGAPVDVTTGLPMTVSNWATDHIMSRTEIAADPRFPLLSPLKREEILLNVPENYLPLTTEANSSKGTLSVEEWIRNRERLKKPIPPPVAAALRAADQRARAAIEQFFKDNLDK